jgi:hypothetical protein
VRSAVRIYAKHQSLLDDLKKKDGAAFDAAYVKAQRDLYCFPPRAV